jgi:cytochrome c peroxidase
MAAAAALAVGTGAGVFAALVLAAAPAAPLSERDLRAILAHGPWPVAAGRDPSNRVSGQPAGVEFGRSLFFDPRLSATGEISCATCHRPDRAFADGRARATGIAPVDRNTIALANLRLVRWYGWDGAADNLWAQSLRPLVEPREMGGSFSHIARLVRGDPELRRQYQAAFGAPPGPDDELVSVDLGKALAAYQETLVTGRAPFDEFRDALARGDAGAAARYPAAARRGAVLFVGKGRCNLCHLGPGFTNGEFHDAGVAYFVAPGRVDAGRHQGIRRVQASRYNLLGQFNDDPAAAPATAVRHVALEHRNFGEFRVPSLRNVACTAPYMHDGSLATLGDVVRHYSDLDLDRLHADGERILQPLRLPEAEIADLVAFLESLGDCPGRPAAPPAD